MAKSKTLRNCAQGHSYYKSSDCPVCPICEAAHNANAAFLNLLAAPARRALENNGINTLQKLSEFSEKEILQFHGMGKSSLPKLIQALSESGLMFKIKK